MFEEGGVVVLVQPLILKNAVTGVYAARITPLGLTAYGATADDAIQAVKEMFAGAVQSRRKLGKLAFWLEHSGVKWFWETDYDQDIALESADGKEPRPANRWRELGMVA